MNTSIDDFLQTSNLDEFLDDDSVIITIKDGHPQLEEFLSNNQALVISMIQYLKSDEFDTNHKTLIKYPYVVSEILGSLNVMTGESRNEFLNLINENIQLPSIFMGYIAKILQKILKHNPNELWDHLTLNNISYLLTNIHNYQMVEAIYSMIIYQNDDNQLMNIDKRQKLIDYLITQLNTQYVEGISQIFELIFQQLNENIQQQKQVLVQHIIKNQLTNFIQLFPQQPNYISIILKAIINSQIISQEDMKDILQLLLLQMTMFTDQLKQLDLPSFGLSRFSILEFLYQFLIKIEYQNINSEEICQLLLSLIAKYPNHNQMHHYASLIISKLVFQNDQKLQISNQILEYIRLKQPNRPYLIFILQEWDIKNDQEVIEYIQLTSNYLLGIQPSEKPDFKLQDDFEAAMEKLTIQQE